MFHILSRYSIVDLIELYRFEHRFIGRSIRALHLRMQTKHLSIFFPENDTSSLLSSTISSYHAQWCRSSANTTRSCRMSANYKYFNHVLWIEMPCYLINTNCTKHYTFLNCKPVKFIAPKWPTGNCFPRNGLFFEFFDSKEWNPSTHSKSIA